MQEILLLYLQNDSLNTLSWAIIEDGRLRQSVYQDDFEGLSSIALSKKVIVIVPGEDVLLKKVNLPKMTRARLLQAIPYALEEQLIADVDTLHFAMGTQKDDKWPVAIVAKEKMVAWQNLLQSHNIEADLFVAANDLLPQANEAWRVLLENKIAIVKTALHDGFVCDRENLFQFLQLGLSTTETKPLKIQIDNHNSVDFSREYPTIEGIPIIETKTGDENFLEIFMQGVLENNAINLLQGPYSLNKSNSLRKQRFNQIGIALVSVWLGLLLLTPVITYYMLKQHLTQLNSSIETIYKKNFPQATNVIAPRIRMEDKMKKLNLYEGKEPLFDFLRDIGQVLQENSGITIKSFDYQNNQLNLEIMATTSDSIADFTNHLAKMGHKVRQQNANIVDNGLIATVMIES